MSVKDIFDCCKDDLPKFTKEWEELLSRLMAISDLKKLNFSIEELNNLENVMMVVDTEIPTVMRIFNRISKMSASRGISNIFI